MIACRQRIAELEASLAALQQPRALPRASAAAPLDAVDRARHLSAISHDLRTPLNAVIGFATLMRNEIFGGLGHPKYRDYADHIEASGQTLLKSTDQLLALASLGIGPAERSARPAD